jgi:uncharacterized coiled-coil protein SlyX
LPAAADAAAASYEERKRQTAERRKRDKASKGLSDRIAALESRIADCEKAIKDLETAMAAPGFYDRRDEAQPIIAQLQALMWQVGDLLNQWEMLQNEARAFADREL